MRRRRKTAAQKSVLISRAPDFFHSAHVLDLREKLFPPQEPGWTPSPLDEFLANPWKVFKKSEAAANSASETAQKIQYRVQFDELKGRFLSAIARARASRKTAGLRANRSRASLAFLAVCLILILPLNALYAYSKLARTRSQILNFSEEAFARLYSGGSAVLSLNLDKAAKELGAAARLFHHSQSEISEMNPALRLGALLLPFIGDKYRSGEQLISAGQHLTAAAQTTINALGHTSAQSSQNGGILGIIEKIEKVAGLILPTLTEANKNLQAVSAEALPPEQLPRFTAIKDKLRMLRDSFALFPQTAEALKELLGASAKKRYLVVFQNNGEIRPTGGFMGSFAIIDVKSGGIQKMKMPGGGTFDLAGDLKVFVKMPAPLQIMRTRWEMQDANWFADFPTSAKKIAWFYEKSGGSTVDGVIAIDATFFKEILKVTGPITLPEYGKTIDYRNFISETQKQVEFEYDKKLNRPKQFLADIAPQVLTKLFDANTDIFELLTAAQEAARQKHWQMFSFDEKLEQFLISQGLAGEIKDNPGGDFLALVNTNIAGQKTDWVMEQSFSHQAIIEEDGSITDTVTIIRTHKGKEGEPLTGVQNVNYLRLYVPSGATLLAASGFKYPPEGSFKVPEEWYADDTDLLSVEGEAKIDEASGTRITNEFGKTVFANWSMTKPGETSVLTFTYKLPLKAITQPAKKGGDALAYTLLLQKQPGSGSDKFGSKIILPAGYQIAWREGIANSENALNEDQFLGIVAARN